MGRHREWAQMAILHWERARGPRKAGAEFVHAHSHDNASGSQGSLFEAPQHTGQARWSKKQDLSMSSRSQGDLQDDLQAPSKDIDRPPVHPRVKDQ